MNKADVDFAVRRWSEFLDVSQVSVDAGDLGRYAQTTGFTSTKPLAILYPKSTDEVSKMVKIAGEAKVPLYPISRGKNWGYGDACAATENQVILDLRHMNRILEVNSQLAYAVIEPGVTQGQLHEYLIENKTGLQMDSTGAGPETSVLGNALERGFGHTRYGDHFLSICGLEIVLADGSVLNTGFGHYRNSRARNVYRYGVGPSLDGLFSQSNFGIVTRMVVWLMPKPEAFKAFFFAAKKENELRDIIDMIAPLKLSGTLNSAVHIANDLRTISSKAGYPFDQTAGVVPLPNDIKLKMRKDLGVGAWNVCGGISGNKEVVAATEKIIRKKIGRFKPFFLSDQRLQKIQKIVGIGRGFGVGATFSLKLKMAASVFRMLKGEPGNEALAGASWRVRDRQKLSKEVLNDPIRAHAGLVWISTIIPMIGSEAEKFVDFITPVYKKYGFDTLITFTLLTERSLCAVTNISFDRRRLDEVAAAAACNDDLVSKMIEAGYIPYRSSPGSFDFLALNSSGFWPVIEKLKSALDPQGIISPGRYEPFDSKKFGPPAERTHFNT